MATSRSSWVLLAALVAALFSPMLVSGHFNLVTPPSIGFDDDKEGTGPCGSFTPDLSASTLPQFHVGGDAIAMVLGHPQANWLFRGASVNGTSCTSWTQLFPIVQQSGLNGFCEPAITAPASWAGSKGVIGVVANAPDGFLYQVSCLGTNSIMRRSFADLRLQCAVVQFVSGVGTPPSNCTNSTGVAAAFVGDTSLTPLSTSSDLCPAGSSTNAPPGSTTSTAPSPTKSTSAGCGNYEALSIYLSVVFSTISILLVSIAV